MSKKNAYWFSHDSNAHDDPKCMHLIDKMGMEGYGIFWSLLEKLRNETKYSLPLKVTGLLAKRWNTKKIKIDSVINDFDLFKIEGDYFYSIRLTESMNYMSEKGKKAAEAKKKKGTSGLPVVTSGTQVVTSGDQALTSGNHGLTIRTEEIRTEDIRTEERISHPTTQKNEENQIEGILHTVDECVEISLKDQNWIDHTKFKRDDLEKFADYLKNTGKFKKVPIDFKWHCFNWYEKRKNSDQAEKPKLFLGEEADKW